MVDGIVEWAMTQGKEKVKKVDEWFAERGDFNEESSVRA